MRLPYSNGSLMCFCETRKKQLYQYKYMYILNIHVTSIPAENTTVGLVTHLGCVPMATILSLDLEELSRNDIRDPVNACIHVVCLLFCSHYSMFFHE